MTTGHMWPLLLRPGRQISLRGWSPASRLAMCLAMCLAMKSFACLDGLLVVGSRCSIQVFKGFPDGSSNSKPSKLMLSGSITVRCWGLCNFFLPGQISPKLLKHVVLQVVDICRLERLLSHERYETSERASQSIMSESEDVTFCYLDDFLKDSGFSWNHS